MNRIKTLFPSLLLLLASGASPAAPVDSVYTTLSLDPKECARVRMDRESGYSLNRCRGVGGYNLLVEYSDDRMDASVEAPNGRQYPLRLGELISNGFSTLGDKAEWRISKRGDKITPFALILRFSPEQEHGIIQYLTVSKIGPGAACLTEVIPPQRKHNEKAREAAGRAQGAACYGAPPAAGIQQIRRKAEAGDPAAQRELGFRYQKGQGVAQDDKAALAWYRKSAKQGYDVAQNDLGYLFGNGIGAPKDLDKARYWYAKAAAQGNEIAAKNLKAIGGAPMTACPDPIHTNQSLSRPQAGWDAAVDQTPNGLLFLNFFDRPPSAGKMLSPDRRSEQRRMEEYAQEWDFPASMAGDIWVSCVYSDTGVSLIRRLPGTIGGCRVTYSSRLEQEGHPVLLETRCK